jgi:SRSO17 transposase
MDVRDLKALRDQLDDYVNLYADCIKTAPSRKHLRTYVNGQISDLERKNVEAIALDAGVPPRSLQEFLGIHRWDEAVMGTRVQHLVQDRHGDENAIVPVDETSFQKKGKKTAGVQRQYCGATGKTDNCVVSVHLGYVTGDFQTLIDSDVYLPEAWLADEERCREAGIPDTLQFRTKPMIALDLLRRTISNGVRFKYVTTDELYGRSARFRREVASMGLIYVVEVPSSQFGWIRRPATVQPTDTSRGAGRPRIKTRLARGARRCRRVDEIAKRARRPMQAFRIKDSDKGPVVWEARAMRFFPRDDGLPDEECWLIIARNVLDGEMKYFLSNAPKGTPVEVMLHVAFARSAIERLFEDSKGEVGLDHFEVRRYKAVMRHLILSMVSMLFLAEQTQRLRKKKPGLDDLPGPESH